MTGTGKTVTRVDLCEAVYQKVGLSRTESSAFVELVLKEITDCLEKGETVKLSSFGSFMVRKKGQRIGRNPKTGTEVPISPRRVMVFKPSAILKQRINGHSVRQRRRQGRLRPNAFNRRSKRSGHLDKAPDAFRTISEVADDLDIPQHVLRFWETRFAQIKPMKRSGGRRYYRPDDVDLLRGIRRLLYGEGYTIRGVQRILKEHGIKSVQGLADGSAAVSFGAIEEAIGQSLLEARRGRRRRASMPMTRTMRAARTTASISASSTPTRTASSATFAQGPALRAAPTARPAARPRAAGSACCRT